MVLLGVTKLGTCTRQTATFSLPQGYDFTHERISRALRKYPPPPRPGGFFSIILNFRSIIQEQQKFNFNDCYTHTIMFQLLMPMRKEKQFSNGNAELIFPLKSHSHDFVTGN